MKEINTPWEEISAYLQNQTDKKSEAVIKKWLNDSPDNIQILNEIVNTHQLSGKRTVFYEPRKDKLWDELMRRISPLEKQKRTVRKIWLRYTSIAAALVLAFFVGQWVSTENNQSESLIAYTEVYAPPGQRTHLVLPDQTKVWLNSGSEIKYPSSFNGNDRDVFIHGECYFEVTKNPHKPFIVHASSINVKVFGTHFNVKEDAKDQHSTVTLLEGKVQVLDQRDKSLSFLEPGQQLSVDRDNIKLRQAKNPKALISWTNGMLIFQDQPFEEVIHYLENWYGVTIQLDNSLYKKHKYTFKVKTESLREVLGLISVITPIDYEIQGDSVKIKRKNS